MLFLFLARNSAALSEHCYRGLPAKACFSERRRASPNDVSGVVPVVKRSAKNPTGNKSNAHLMILS
jgi:hypothetical protein